MHDQLRTLPSVNQLLTEPGIAGLRKQIPHQIIVTTIQAILEEQRQQVRAGGSVLTRTELLVRICDQLALYQRRLLQPVINGTGVLIHTNLGRSPLPKDTMDWLTVCSIGYTNLEYHLNDGERGSRYQGVSELLCLLTGAEDSLVVNNNAAAVLLTLSALASGKEVIVSRGELVEIGGGFRIPEVIAESGCILKEVGTTNKTRLSDYEQAISDNTAVILKVHPSNYQIHGFTESVPRVDLHQLCKSRNLWLVEDIGSGAMQFPPLYKRGHDPFIHDVIAHVDVLTFSGDKLLGGPQAGIILGEACAITCMKQKPLLRALRIDKLSLLALQHLLLKYMNNELSSIPIMQMLTTSIDHLTNRVNEWKKSLGPGWKGQILPGQSTIGGGSLPGETIPTVLLALTSPMYSVTACSSFLRLGSPPVIGRVKDEKLLLDPRTILPDQDRDLVAVLKRGLDPCTS